MNRRNKEFKQVAAGIREKILTDTSIDDWRKQNFELMASKLEQVADDNIYLYSSQLDIVKRLKEDAEKFFQKAQEFKFKGCDYRKDDVQKIEFEDKLSRILAGIACELILKALFVARGCCVHKIDGKAFPTMITQISSEEKVTGRTVSFTDLLTKLEIGLPDYEQKMRDSIKSLLEIARDWRNNDAHLGLVHSGSFADFGYVETAFKTLSQEVKICILQEERRLIKEWDEKQIKLWETLKQKLQEVGITQGRDINDFPEIVVNSVPGTNLAHKGSMRKELYSLSPFMIKSCDGGKSGARLSPLEELRFEVAAWQKYKDIPIVEKFAILHLSEFNEQKVYLVEKEIEPFDKEEWRKRKLLGPAIGLLRCMEMQFPKVGDFKLENMGYDKDDNKIKFFDVFPQKRVEEKVGGD